MKILLMAVLIAMPALAADRWIKVTTPHFEMYTTADEKEARAAVLYFERVREFFMRASPVRTPGEFPTRIVAFRDPAEFRAHAPNQQVSAYFAPGPVRDTIVMQEPSPANFPVAIHEYVHRVIWHSGLHIPLWLNEGWADVYSTLRPVKDGVAVGDLIQRDVTALEKGQWFTLNDLAAVTPGSKEYNESTRTGMFYAESWALAHMLYLAPDYKDNFGKFVMALHRGGTIDEAAKAAYNKPASQLFLDLRDYLTRKKLVGTVFLTPFEKPDEAVAVTAVSPYDSDLVSADLFAVSGHPADAKQIYTRLKEQDPKRSDAFASSGYLAMEMKDPEGARADMAKAFELGTTDPQLCLLLASLDHTAKQPDAQVVTELERALKLRPDYNDALFELGYLKAEQRDFEAALPLLSRVTVLPTARLEMLFNALAYTNLERGNLDAARSNAEKAHNVAQTPVQKEQVEKLQQLIAARSTGPATAHAGEKVVRIHGTALGLRCVAPGPEAISKLGVTVDGKPVLFDFPAGAAVELLKHPGGTAELKCGPLPAFPVIVEFVPGSVAVKDSAGIVRWLEY